MTDQNDLLHRIRQVLTFGGTIRRLLLPSEVEMLRENGFNIKLVEGVNPKPDGRELYTLRRPLIKRPR